MEAEEFRVCGQLAHVRFRRKAKEEGTLLTSCCQEPGHTGDHVYGILTNRHGRTPTLDFVEEVHRGELKVHTHVDLKPGPALVEQEVQALWQYFQYLQQKEK